MAVAMVPQCTNRQARRPRPRREILSPSIFCAAQRNIGDSATMVSSGGYECTFVEPPTSTRQTQCPICLQVLRDPYRTTCCRSNFCHSCSQQLQTDRSCPTCRETNFSFVNNNNLKRFLNQLAVLCKHSDGCEWIGKLEDLEHHLNEVINSGESFQY